MRTLEGAENGGEPAGVEVAEASGAARANVPFRLAGGPQPLLLVPVRVDGTGPYEFILDTGAGTSLLSPGLADRLRIRRTGHKKAAAAAGELDVELGTVASLAIGSATARDLPVGITAEVDRIGAVVGAEISGDVGYDVLKNFRVCLDYRRSVLTLEWPSAPEAPARPSEVPFRLAHRRKPLLLVPALVDGTGPWSFVLDTGASMTLISPGLARSARIAGGSPVRVVGAGGRVAALGGRVRSLAVGEAVREDVDVVVAPFVEPLGDAVGATLDGILGHNFLRAFRVTIDYPRSMLELGRA